MNGLYFCWQGLKVLLSVGFGTTAAVYLFLMITTPGGPGPAHYFYLGQLLIFAIVPWLVSFRKPVQAAGLLCINLGYIGMAGAVAVWSGLFELPLRCVDLTACQAINGVYQMGGDGAVGAMMTVLAVGLLLSAYMILERERRLVS